MSMAGMAKARQGFMSHLVRFGVAFGGFCLALLHFLQLLLPRLKLLINNLVVRVNLLLESSELFIMTLQEQKGASDKLGCWSLDLSAHIAICSHDRAFPLHLQAASKVDI